MTKLTPRANSPMTISLEIPSLVPNSFFIFILTSPLSFLWHLVRRSLLSEQDVSIFTLAEGESWSSFLYHCIFIGVPPENGSFHSAFSPAFIVTGVENLSKASLSTLGGSFKERKSMLLFFWKGKLWLINPQSIWSISGFFSDLLYQEWLLIYGLQPQSDRQLNRLCYSSQWSSCDRLRLWSFSHRPHQLAC